MSQAGHYLPGALMLTHGELCATLARNALQRSRLYTWARGAELAEESFRRCHANARREAEEPQSVKKASA